MQDTGHRVVLNESRSVDYELIAVNGSIVDNITVDDTLSFSFELYNSVQFIYKHLIWTNHRATSIVLRYQPQYDVGEPEKSSMFHIVLFLT